MALPGIYDVTLVNKDDASDDWNIRILLHDVTAQSETQIGQIPQDFHDYHDYYDDLVDAIIENISALESFITQFVACYFTGDATYAPIAHYYNTMSGLWGMKDKHKGTVVGYPLPSAGEWEPIPPAKYWRLQGSDPDTCWYAKFAPRANSSSIDIEIYDHSLTLQQTISLDSECVALEPYSYGIPCIQDWDAFLAAQTHNASCQEQGKFVARQSTYSEMYDPDSAYLYVNCVYSYRVSEYCDYYTFLWYLYNNGGGDAPVPPEPESDDPYNPVYPPGGEDPGGGTRNPYDEGDNIPIPGLPPFNLADSGFTSLWIPSRTTLGLLASYLWSDNVVQTLIKNLYANPIDVIISLGIVPFSVTPDGSAEICVGTHGTGITSAYVDDDCVIIDCGEVNISEMKPGGYLNFSPYTEAKLFLPFVGFVDIDVDVAMNSEIHVEYHVCLTNGSFVAFIESTNQNTNKVIAEFEGNCKITVPITAADYSSMWQAVLGTLTAPLLAAAGGAASGAIGGQFIGASAALTSDFAAEGANQGLANSIGQGIGDAGNHITDKLSPNISCSGSFSAGSGMLGNRKPFIVLKSPEVKQPENYNVYRGYPLQAEKVLNTLEGYTEVSNIQLKLPEASGTETGEAERLLRNGFIIGTASHPAIQNDGIALCKNNSPINQIGKSVALISQLNGDFRDSVNMMHPVVRIEKTDPTDFNYVYIGEFKRWYFVNKIEVVRTGILDIHLKEDVLESFANDILAHNAIVSNNAKAYNVYLNDRQLITTQRSLYWRKEFPHGFMENDGYEWVMLIAGRRQTS